MLFWIFAALILFLAQIYLPAALYLPTEGMGRHMGPRDDLPEAPVMVGRARRALANMQENMPIFLSLAVLAVAIDGADMARAVLGAQLFVLGRLAYVACYMFGIPYVRSAAYAVALFGCLLIALALI